MRATYLDTVSVPGVPRVLYLRDADGRSASSWTDRQYAASRVVAAEAVRLIAEMTGQFDVNWWAIDAVALEELTGG